MVKQWMTRVSAKVTLVRAVRALVPALVIVIALGALSAPTAAAAAGSQPATQGKATDASSTDRLAEYGVTLAFQGEVARAESVFVRLLSVAPRDARALNNLGNLYLMKGESGVAMAFYARAAKADTSDAGIPLNRSVALMLSGEDAAAKTEAAKAVEMAGGLERAGSLLAVRPELMAESKQAKTPSRTYLSKSEVMALLKGAKTAVPSGGVAPAGKAVQGAGTKADSIAGAPGGGAPAAPAAKPKSWRSAGLRASDFSNIATSLYWKM